MYVNGKDRLIEGVWVTFNPLHSTMASSETKENIYGAKEMCYRWALNPQGLVLVDLY